VSISEPTAMISDFIKAVVSVHNLEKIQSFNP